ncbi:hypothetical protein BKA69DRAFT_1089162 [Paraphysoderma sedebokerense]|nr:hypothetical protein BKA69DRAFT_1089162 [Paraphysoderma sedebokerense]
MAPLVPSGSKQKPKASASKVKSKSKSKKDSSKSNPHVEFEMNSIPITTDSRFSHVHNDPRFMRPKKKDTKVKIDKRFREKLETLGQEMSKSGPKVDKYGRPLAQSKEEDLKRFYRMNDSDDDSESDGDIENDETVQDRVEAHQSESASEDDLEVRASDSETDGDESAVDEEVDDEATFDPARGEGLIESSSDEEEHFDFDAEGSMEEESEDEDNVPIGDETRRFAVVNMDWDNLKATDLYKVFDSVKPQGGLVKSVTIYPSEFGKERLTREEVEGPPAELFRQPSSATSSREPPNGIDDFSSSSDLSDDDEESLLKDDDGQDYDPHALRKYQLDRLKYYYAVVDCDTVDTASHIYKTVDGTEFEKTSNFFDIRFVPDAMTFDEQPKDKATDAPMAYKPADYVTKALQHTNVKLTWDEDDPDRTRITKRKITAQDIKNLDFKAFLASDSEHDSDQGHNSDPEESKEEIRNKYRALLLSGGGDGDDEDKKGGMEMEITFTPGLEDGIEELVKKKKEKKTKVEETSIEAYLRKEKERKKKKKMKKLQAEPNDDVEAEIEGALSNEVVEENAESTADFGFDDPFFKQDLDVDEAEFMEKKKLKKEKKLAKKKNEVDDVSTPAVTDSELALLLLDDNNNDTTKSHFDLREIMKAEKAEKSKKKRKNKKKGNKEEEEVKDNFELDLNDNRFADMFDSHLFTIDPTNPNFKKTKNMSKLLQERSKRVLSKSEYNETNKPKSLNPIEKSSHNSENEKRTLSSLVDKVCTVVSDVVKTVETMLTMALCTFSQVKRKAALPEDVKNGFGKRRKMN